jgi:hypothetical protein
VQSVEGETLSLTKVTRSEMGAYLCIAANGVPPSVSKRMMVHVHCKCDIHLFDYEVVLTYVSFCLARMMEMRLFIRMYISHGFRKYKEDQCHDVYLTLCHASRSRILSRVGGYA